MWDQMHAALLVIMATAVRVRCKVGKYWTGPAGCGAYMCCRLMHSLHVQQRPGLAKNRHLHQLCAPCCVLLVCLGQPLLLLVQAPGCLGFLHRGSVAGQSAGRWRLRTSLFTQREAMGKQRGTDFLEDLVAATVLSPRTQPSDAIAARRLLASPFTSCRAPFGPGLLPACQQLDCSGARSPGVQARASPHVRGKAATVLRCLGPGRCQQACWGLGLPAAQGC